ncbi:retrovirus-related Pol polyprotein from transposon 412 [Trichonephila clavipes]|uniref:Retrovirus-related Pol polyprotein from transposon 412 n=1 Tax=Trichonephila clavipes TaxID=2585209 RepID=A0A8X6SNM5_TRICX|nr:retrovirus-related Pol polyprotein from transposon 412 [Trichonephila clavipes]
MDLFLTLFERQMKLLNLSEDLWVPYLISALPSDVTSLIVQKFRELFSRHRKSPNGTWKDYYFEIRAQFEGWLNELKIDSFDGLKKLMIADQMKKRCSPGLDPGDTQMSSNQGGEATNILEQHINTGNSPPIFVPPYRMSPVKNCPGCIKYNASNQKPSGLLQTPVPAQRFETLAIDLFGPPPLPESKDGKRWILIIEDCTTKWVELFALPNATAKECAITLIEEVLLRYGIPRRLISDNGTQFVSAVLAILVQDKHGCWSEKLLFIRFALNTAKCETTGQTEAFLNFGRELRTPSEVVNDIRVVIQNDNFVPEITPYLKKFA